MILDPEAGLFMMPSWPSTDFFLKRAIPSGLFR